MQSLSPLETIVSACIATALRYKGEVPFTLGRKILLRGRVKGSAIQKSLSSKTRSTDLATKIINSAS